LFRPILFAHCLSSIVFFFFYSYGAHPDLHSFPTRRSSDLEDPRSSRDRQRGLSREGGVPAGRARTRCGVRLPRRTAGGAPARGRSEEHTSELQSRGHLVCRLLLEKKKENTLPKIYEQLVKS